MNLDLIELNKNKAKKKWKKGKTIKKERKKIKSHLKK
jgi:hypothetical protein